MLRSGGPSWPDFSSTALAEADSEGRDVADPNPPKLPATETDEDKEQSGPDPALHNLATNGIARNRKRQFHIDLPGSKFNTLITLLDAIALDTKSILILRDCVHLGDEIMDQLREQGF